MMPAPGLLAGPDLRPCSGEGKRAREILQKYDPFSKTVMTFM
jgi:hypothetical protein